jgi:hypothetical protein
MAAKKKTAAESTAATPPPPGGKYSRVKAVTLPVLKLVDETPVYVKITGPMFEGKEQKPQMGPDGKPKAQMEPATLVPVVSVETGEVGQIIAGAVLEGILNDSYPEDAYVGKAFEIVKHAKKDGKRYNTYSVFEIDAGA